MITKVQKWGNSLALRIPKTFTNETHLNEGSEVDISVNGNKIIINVLKNRYNLEDLLSNINVYNIHNEISTSTPLGNEIW